MLAIILGDEQIKALGRGRSAERYVPEPIRMGSTPFTVEWRERGKHCWLVVKAKAA